MELLDKLNTFSSLEAFKKMDELTIDQKYPVTEIALKDTKYGSKVIVKLSDGSVIFLPQRCDKMTSEYLQLNDMQPLYFIYLGSKCVGKAKPMLLFKFEQ